MDLCVMIEGQEGVSWAEWQAIAAACEEHRISALFRSDHYLPLGGHEERPVLDAWGRSPRWPPGPRRLRLGALVSPATFRHPSVFAKLVVTADHVSGGRIDAGLGAGWNEREHAAYGFPYDTVGDRFDRYAEQLEIVHGLWARAVSALRGATTRTTTSTRSPSRSRSPCRSSSAGWPSPGRSPWPTATPASTTPSSRPRRRRASAVRWSHHGWERAGRDPASLVFSLMTGYGDRPRPNQRGGAAHPAPAERA